MTKDKIGVTIGDKAFYLFLLIYTTGLIYLSYALNIWIDEAYTLHTTSNNLAEVLRLSYTFEGQVPVYFLLLAIWRLISVKVFFARLFSLICIGFAAIYFNKLEQQVTGKKGNRWMTVIFLVNPFTVWSAIEIRVYALLILLSVLAIYYFIRYYLSNKNKDLYAFLIVALIGVYTQYFFTLLIASLAFFFFLYKGWKLFFRFCLYLVPVVLLFLPNLYFLRYQVQMHQLTIIDKPILATFINVLYTPQDFLLALQLVPFDRWVRWIIKCIFIISILFAYFKLYKKRHTAVTGEFERLNTLFFATGLLIMMYALVVVYTKILYVPKYMSIVFPFVCLIYLLFKQYRPSVQKRLYIFYSIYFITLLVMVYRVPIKNYDYIHTAKYISATERPGEPLFFYTNLIALPFSKYYTGQNKIVPLPHPITFDNNYISNIQDTVSLKQKIKNGANNSASFLFISNDLDSIELNKNLNRGMVDSFLTRQFNTELDTLFYGRSNGQYLRIRRFVLK